MTPERNVPPLATRALTRGGLTMLARVLGADESARITGLDAAPLAPSPTGYPQERLRLSWEGEAGSAARALRLVVLPAPTWSQRVNPLIPAPAEVIRAEGDLSTVVEPFLTDGIVAAGRARDGRPAWLLYEDLPLPPPPAPFVDETATERVLVATARHLALHWGAGRVLDEVYPWLPRWEQWVRAEWDDPEVAIAAMANQPRTILHGAWRWWALHLTDERLIVPDWSRIQVGPAAWDIATLLAPASGAATRDAALERILDEIAAIIPELSDATRALVRDGVAQAKSWATTAHL